MKTIGLIGGLSWEATALYYRLLNEGAARVLGPNHNARSVIVSVDFAEALALAEADDWDGLAALLGDAARQCEAGGAELVLVGANTAHLVADQVAAAITVPLLHIVDATGEAARTQGLRHVGLIGTRFTMQSQVYRQRLSDQYGLIVTTPEAAAQAALHRIITQELTLGRIEDASRERCMAIIEDLAARGADGIVVGCTELPLLLRQQDSRLPFLDTTALHVEAALRLAIPGAQPPAAMPAPAW
jgi:aspartate racemase